MDGAPVYCVFHQIEPEICEYPDSDKGSRSTVRQPRNATKLDVVVHRSANVDYWDGES